MYTRGSVPSESISSEDPSEDVGGAARLDGETGGTGAVDLVGDVSVLAADRGGFERERLKFSGW